jgi:hypothetical protein
MSMFLRNKPMAWTGLVVALSFWMNQGARGKGMLLNIGYAMPLLCYAFADRSIATSALFINYIL